SMKRSFALALLICTLRLTAQNFTPQQYREDFEYFWRTIKEDYCYWDKKQTDWERVRTVFAPRMDTITSRGSFVLVMEKVFNELYDHHASMNTNVNESQRLVPSGTDIWAVYAHGKPVITEVRIGSGAERSGLRAGMEVVSFNDIPVETAILPLLPMSLSKPDAEAKNYALRILLAGKSVDDRKIVAKDKDGTHDYFPERPNNLLIDFPYNGYIESKIYPGNIGYIRINNRLGENELIALFDSVLQSLKNTKALILDLRATPSGGNTTVARAIIGSFISKDGFYQKHELTAEERTYGIKRSWMEIVSPRKFIYTKPLVLLVDHWTGSIAEGITIGFDAFKRAMIIGTPMAGLNGAVYSYQMPNTKIGFSFPVEKLFHINGTAREKFKPSIIPDLTKQKAGEDLLLNKAVSLLIKKKN
ncbi:MAG: S41 family peptidase, partial [Flavisolibacter sp.]